MTTPEPESEPLIGEVVLGRYAVEARVARGGFAVVYRARHLELGAPVAIKVLTAADRFGGEARRQYLAQFRQEAVTLASLNHPALVRVLDVGTVGAGETERPCIAMEWLDGVSLDDELAARAGVGRGPREALALLQPAFDALACAHDAGVSHRDLKPSNLMRVVARRGEPGLRVIDFGVAKVAPDADGPGDGSTSTASPITGYTAAYAAPEQISRSRTGPWTDVHALALILVEVLRGARAYTHRDGAELLEEILAAERPTPARFGLRVGPWEEVLRRALHRSPDARPRSASALWAALSDTVDAAQRAWEGAAPVGSPPPRRSRRRAVMVAGVALVALAVPVGWARRTRPAPAVAHAAVPADRVETPAAQGPGAVLRAPSPPARPPPRDPVEAAAPTRVVRLARRPLPPRGADAGAPRATGELEPRVVVE
ncbi:MAG: serine/threonine-protein kinase [Polyangiales bacterium]